MSTILSSPRSLKDLSFGALHSSPPRTFPVSHSDLSKIHNAMSAVPRVSAALDRSRSAVKLETPGCEYFWGTELKEEGDKKEWKWDVKSAEAEASDAEGEGSDSEEDPDFMTHTLFLKMAVLGDGAAAGEANLVELESRGVDGKPVKAAVVHLVKGQGPQMCQLDLSVAGRQGATLRLLQGSGPVHLSGSYMIETELEDDEMNMTEFETEEEEDVETAESAGDESLNETGETAGETGEGTEEDAEDDEESAEDAEVAEPAKGKKAAANKRKMSPPKAAKKTKKAKMEKTEKMDCSDEDEDEDEEDDEEEEEEEEEKPAKKAANKKAAPAKAQEPKKAKKIAPSPAAGKKGKKVKK